MLNAFRKVFRKHEVCLTTVYLITLITISLASFIIIIRSPAPWPGHRQIEQMCQWLINKRQLSWQQEYEQTIFFADSGKLAQAAQLLENLNARIPFQTRKGFDGALRKSILRDLAALYGQMRKKNLTFRTFEKLIAFEPNSAREVVLYGSALMDFGEGEQGEKQLLRCLEINPNHYGATKRLIDYLYASRRFAEIVTIYDSYRTAFAVSEYADVESIRTGMYLIEDRTLLALFRFPIVIDGQPHTCKLPVAREKDMLSGKEITAVFLSLKLHPVCEKIEFSSIKILGHRNIHNGSAGKNSPVGHAVYKLNNSYNIKGPPITKGLSLENNSGQYTVMKQDIYLKLLLIKPVKASEIDIIEIQVTASKKMDAQTYRKIMHSLQFIEADKQREGKKF